MTKQVLLYTFLSQEYLKYRRSCSATWVFRNIKWVVRKWGPVVESYEHGDDLLGPIKCGEYLDYLSKCHLLKENTDCLWR
jgi:hypothetical protein